jgi:molybdenum cofactor synthesis domain-containing protein
MTSRTESPSSAAIASVGDELVTGRIADLNASYIAARLDGRGIDVRALAVLPDAVDAIAEFVEVEHRRRDFVFLAGGLGATPDDATRDGVAQGLARPTTESTAARELLEEAFRDDGAYVACCARLPAGSTVLANPLGGAPGFRVDNVWAFPGEPAEARAIFDAAASELPLQEIHAWSRTYPTAEHRIAHVLDALVAAHPGVTLGSYPSYAGGHVVRVELRTREPEPLRAAADWLERAMEAEAVVRA